MDHNNLELTKIFKDLCDLYPKSKVMKNFNIGRFSYFKTGGSCDWLFMPQNKEALQHFLSNKPKQVNITVLGAGSNVLIREGGIDGVVILLNRFDCIEQVDSKVIKAEAMAFDKSIALFAMNKQLGGLEFFYTIPGCAGGALAMNAGAYGSEIKDVFEKAEAITLNGKYVEITKKDIIFDYRNIIITDYKQLIFTSVYIKGQEAQASKIKATMNNMEQQRQHTQPPASSKTGGSTFTNPSLEVKAWQLIKKSGANSIKVGGAAVSSLHCNFIQNINRASAQDIESLIHKVQQKVFEEFAVNLKLEIKVIGKHENI